MFTLQTWKNSRFNNDDDDDDDDQGSHFSANRRIKRHAAKFSDAAETI